MNAAPATRSGCSAARTTPGERRARHADDDFAFRHRRVHHRERVRREFADRVCLGAGRAVGAAVPAPVERDDTAVPGQKRDLHFPVPRVDERPRRQQQDRRYARSVDLVEEAHAVALDEALLVGVARTGLLAGCGGNAHRSRSTNSRTSWLNMTGSRACGACPPPSTRTNAPPPCCASASPRV